MAGLVGLAALSGCTSSPLTPAELVSALAEPRTDADVLPQAAADADLADPETERLLASNDAADFFVATHRDEKDGEMIDEICLLVVVAAAEGLVGSACGDPAVAAETGLQVSISGEGTDGRVSVSAYLLPDDGTAQPLDDLDDTFETVSPNIRAR